jgi:DNA-binding IclR family transcriptional regulator
MSKIVARTLDFLETFADQKRPLTSSEIARRLEIPASSCHDVIQALLERGYLYEFTARGGYYPTLRLYELAKTIADHDPIVLRADSLLRTLRDKVDESILLSKVDGLSATYLLSIQPAHPLRFLATIGGHVRNLHASSAGKALLANLDEPVLANYLKSATLTGLTPRTITSKTALREELALGNRRGWFLNREESQEGLITLSARFVWASAVYIVTIAGPTSRLAPQLAKAAELLTSVCKSLEAPTRTE